MPQPAIRARAKALREASARRRAAWLAGLVGSVQQVLVERADGRGHAGNYAEARVECDAVPGSVMPMRVRAVEGEMLVGGQA